ADTDIIKPGIDEQHAVLAARCVHRAVGVKSPHCATVRALRLNGRKPRDKEVAPGRDGQPLYAGLAAALAPHDNSSGSERVVHGAVLIQAYQETLVADVGERIEDLAGAAEDDDLSIRQQ